MSASSVHVQSTFLKQSSSLSDPLQTSSTQTAYTAELLSFAAVMYHGPGSTQTNADQAQGARRAEPPVVGSNVSNAVPRHPPQPRHPYYTVESEPHFAPQQEAMPHHDPEADDPSPFAYNPPSTAGGAPPSAHHQQPPVQSHATYQPAYQYQYAQPAQQVAPRQPPEAPPSSAGSQHAGQAYYGTQQPNYPSPTYAPQRQPQVQFQQQQAHYPASAYHGQAPGDSPTQQAHHNVGLGIPSFTPAAGMPFPPQAQVQFPQYVPQAQPGQPAPRLFTVGSASSNPTQNQGQYETRFFPDMLSGPQQQQADQQHQQQQAATQQQQAGAYAAQGYNVHYGGQATGPFLFNPPGYANAQAGPSNPSRGRRLHREIGYEEDHRYHCPDCSFITERSQDLRRHMKKHGKARTRPCSRCGRDFARSDALTRHQKGTKNCPRIPPKGEGEQGKEGEKKDEPPADDEEEEERDAGDGTSRQGGSSTQGTSQRPNSAWSAYGGTSEYQGGTQHGQQHPNMQSRPAPSALQGRAHGLRLQGMHAMSQPSPLDGSSGSMPSSVTLASSAVSSANASISPSASTTKFHTYHQISPNEGVPSHPHNHPHGRYEREPPPTA